MRWQNSAVLGVARILLIFEYLGEMIRDHRKGDAVLQNNKYKKKAIQV